MKNWKSILIISIVPIVSFIIGIYTLGHYGINWDEPYHYRRGQAFLQYILTGQKTYDDLPKYKALKGDSDNPSFRNGQKYFEDNQKANVKPDLANNRSFYQDDAWNGEFFIDVENSYGHPPLNGILAALTNKIFYQNLGMVGDLESYRLFIVTIVSLSIFIIAYFMWFEFGIIESIFTTLALSTYPLLLGEQHFNIKDPVETTFYAITIIFAYMGLKNNKFTLLILSLVTFSLGLSTKFNIVFALLPLLFWYIFHIINNKLNIKTLLKSGIIYKIILILLIAPIVTLSTLVIFYPTLWKDPMGGLLLMASFYLGVGYPNSPTLGYSFFGLLNTFPITWIVYTTPPVLIVLFLGSITYLKRLIYKSDFVFLLFVWILITIARNSLFGALSYGGVRIIMEYIPALAMICGISAGFLIKLNKNKNYQLIAATIILLGFVPTVYKLIRIHPNENVYFNSLIGGLSGAKDKNIPYWGDSNGNAYYLGLKWLNDNAEKNSLVTTPVGNTSNIPRFKLRDDIAVSPYYWSGLKHSGEYVIELTHNYIPMNWFALKYLNEAMIPVYEVKVDNVAIAKVWKNDVDHVKDSYKNTKNIQAKIISNIKEYSLTLELPNVEELMSVDIYQPVKNCEAVKTGYVTTSIEGKLWDREIEDIARDQLNRQELKGLESIFQYHFMAKEVKYIKFYTDSESNCLIKANKADAIVLK